MCIKFSFINFNGASNCLGLFYNEVTVLKMPFQFIQLSSSGLQKEKWSNFLRGQPI